MKRIRKILRFCADIVYPNRCPCCGGFIVWSDYLCIGCEEKSAADINDICHYCGKFRDECICAQLLRYDSAAAVTYYEDEAKNGILEMKSSRSRNFGYFAGEKLGRIIKSDPVWRNADGIVPVPMNASRRFAKGYNQAETIAREISSVTGIPVMNDCIIKLRGFKSQHTLNADDRKKNTKCFIASGRDLGGMRLIIVDDILTTGSTLDRCADILKQCGAEAVYAAVGATVRRKREENKWQQ